MTGCLRSSAPILILSGACVFLACGSDETVIDENVTGIRLTVVYEGALDLDSVEVIATIDGAPFQRATIDLPSPSAEPGQREDTIVLLVDDSLAASNMALEVKGRRALDVRAQGTTEVTLVARRLVDARVMLVDIGGPTVCGDGVTLSPERCDDGGTASGDGCSETCAIEPGYACTGQPSQCAATCGNAALDAGEDCDDGNLATDDGCSATCTVDAGWSCQGTPSVCTMGCGDGVITGAEVCDDNNTVSGDGCDDQCGVEPGWACTGAPSVCNQTCGNGAIDANETCDDGNSTGGDGCGADCATEPGFTCPGPGQACTPNCGDGQIVSGEECDDGRTDDGDGCSMSCQIEPGFMCSGTPSMCARCGNGVIEGAEVCDDSNMAAGDGCSQTCEVEPGFVCSGMPSVCSRCGNAALDPAEVCDGAELAGETCLSRGHLDGVLSCDASCGAFVLTACGPPINSAQRIQQAINQAYGIAGGPEVVSIQPGRYVINGNLDFEECNGGACPSGPQGLTLRPLGGAVTLVGGRLRVRSGNNTLELFNIANAPNAILLEARGATSGNNTLRNLQIEYEGVQPNEAIVIESGGNTVTANKIANFTDALGSVAAVFDGASGTTFSMNVIFGRWSNAIHLADVPLGAGSPLTFVDHNSVFALTGTGVWVERAGGLCYRNNIVFGMGLSTGLRLDGLALSANCPNAPSSNNVSDGHAIQCTGAECASTCFLNGAFCDRSGNPGWAFAPNGDRSNLCLRPVAASPYVDTGADVGADMVDGAAATFLGTAPEVGARESGAMRSFGSAVSTCP